MADISKLLIKLYRILRGKGIYPKSMQGIAYWVFDHVCPNGIRKPEGVDFKIVVNRSYMSDVVRGLLLNGYHQKYEMELFKNAVRDGDTVVDIGANVGFYSLAASPLVGINGNVFAFEPQQNNWDSLLKNIEVNGYRNITPVCKAVSDKVGRAEFYSTKQHLTECGFGNHDNWVSLVVDTVTLDDYFKGKRVDVIKMDAEGSESLVYNGMVGVLRDNKHLKLFTEFSIPMMTELDCDPSEYLHNLVASGFKLHYIDFEHEQLEYCGTNQIMKRAEGKDSVHLYCER